jgi:hypothetical protein
VRGEAYVTQEATGAPQGTWLGGSSRQPEIGLPRLFGCEADKGKPPSSCFQSADVIGCHFDGPCVRFRAPWAPD